MACEQCDHIQAVAEKREADLTDEINERDGRIKALELALGDVQGEIDVAKEYLDDASKIIEGWI